MMPVTSVQLTVNRSPRSFSRRAASQPGGALCILKAGMSLLQVQDLALAISETHEILQPGEALMNGNPVF